MNALDALHVLRRVAGLQPYAACIAAGNVKCDDGIDAVDSVYILKHVAALPVNVPLGCPAIGDPVPLSSTAVPEVGFYHGPLPFHEMPKEVSPGHDFTFTLTFENTGTAMGYGPYIDLYLPALGIDDESGNGPCDGITFVQADQLQASPPTLLLNTFPASGHAIRPTTATPPMSCTKPVSVASIGGPITPLNVHPFGGSIAGAGSPPGGYELMVIELPFGSYAPTEGKTYVDVKAHLSDHADANQPLTMYSRGGFRFGDSQLGTNPPVPIEQIPFVHEATTPMPFTISKVCTLLSGAPCPENETATGPNFPMDYVITVDIDDGLTISPLIVEDILPDNVQYADNLQYADGVVTTPPSVIQEPSLTLAGRLAAPQVRLPDHGDRSPERYRHHLPVLHPRQGFRRPADPRRRL